MENENFSRLRISKVIKKTLSFFLPLYILILILSFYIYKIQSSSDLKLKKEQELHTISSGINNISDELDPVIEDIIYLKELITDTYNQSKNKVDFRELNKKILMFAQTHREYDQIRFIDKKGWERLRINNSKETSSIVDTENLQFKGNRYYFQDIKKLGKGLYISPFDLNIEKGTIEQPIKPMVRLGIPVSVGDETYGYVFFNFIGKILIEKTEKTLRQKGSELMLLNRNSYWLKGINKEVEWASMYNDKKNVNFKTKYPDEWKQIQSGNKGQFITQKGLFTFSKIHPLNKSFKMVNKIESNVLINKYHWILVSFIEDSVFHSAHYKWSFFMIVFSLITFFVLGFISYRITSLSILKKENEKRLQNSEETLRKTVKERTRELEESNKKLINEIESKLQNQFDFEESEKKYRTLIETMSEGLMVINAAGIITYANEQLLNMLETDVKNKHYSDFFDEKNLAVFENERKKRFEGIAKPYEVSWLTKSGKDLHTIISPSIIKDEIGNFNGSFGIITDITQRKNDEMTIHLNRDRLKALFELSQMGQSSEQELADFALEKAVKITGSTGGYFHFYNENEKNILLTSWSEDVLKTCESSEGTHYPLEEAGIWADCIRQRKAVFHNDYSKEKNRKGCPEGHFTIKRHMSIPVYDCKKIIAIAGVGNKATDYDETDAEQLTLLMTETWRIITRNRVKKELVASEAKHRSMMEAMDDPAYICSPDYKIYYTNPAMEKWLGGTHKGKLCYSSIYGLEERCSWCTFEKINNMEHTKYTTINPRDGRHYNVSSSPMLSAEGKISKFTIFRDITETLNLEKQLRQVQKLEAIGTLAGGIAHDFNNILFAIMGYAEISLSTASKDSGHRDYLKEILSACYRAKDLVNQILTFSRQTEQEIQPIRIQIIIKEAMKLLKASLPSTIQMRSKLISKSHIMADPTQIHQIIMNICTNGAHAMEKNGGTLMIELSNFKVDKGFASQFINMSVGNYIHLKISDTGHGIKNENLERIFEPFYTTKPDGKGTGLGLSLVDGIVKNHKGHISVESELNSGTTFNIYFPVLEKISENYTSEIKNEDLPLGNEKVMVVDDEIPITKIISKFLTKQGYKVDCFTDPEQALDIFTKSEYDIVLTDMTMPNMTGDVLAEKIHKKKPEIPVILITGFSNKVNDGQLPNGVRGLIMKPVIRKDLIQQVRQTLDKMAS